MADAMTAIAKNELKRFFLSRILQYLLNKCLEIIHEFGTFIAFSGDED